MNLPSDTIAALATPPGTAAIALVRISGPDTARFAAEMGGGAPPPRVARHVSYRRRDGLLLDDVLATLTGRPGNQHVVITGRDAPERLVEAADLVTEMGKVRHPMDAGQKGQRGIEW